ncbi:MAG: hypothetical protein OQJ98_01550 [Candidatus Pacebacteria bacterium]|nr:hypothetical protein [Candidatus Paceibacterota bacterium]
MKFSLKSYRNIHFSFNILALYLNRLLLQFGFGVVGVFGVIFFFEELNHSIEKTIILFMVAFFLTALLTPIGAMLIGRVGMKRLMMYAVPFAALSSIGFLLAQYYLFAGIMLYLLASSIYKILYWVPYHVDFTSFTSKRARGRQMSILITASQVLAVLTPFVGGFMIVGFGFTTLFIASVCILLSSVTPLFFIEDKKEKYSYSYLGTFSELINKKNRSLTIGYFGDGAQTVVSAVIWPIFVFLLLQGEYLVVGIVSSVTIFILGALRFVVGDLVDRWSRKRVLTVGSFLNMTGWIVKVFIETGFQVFLLDTYHGLGRVVNRLSIDVTTYDIAADNGHYIDEFTVLKEVSLNLGRTAMLGLVGVLVLFFPLKVAFIAAAGASLFVTLLNNPVRAAK